MTPRRAPRGTSGHENEGTRAAGRPGGGTGATPTPRATSNARVPGINDVREHPPRNPKNRKSWVPSEDEIQAARDHRRQAIETLLHHYRDVLEGVPDREHRSSDELLALMCPAWNHRSYQQLERLLYVMQQRWPKLRQALRVRFERYTERRVAWCKRCGEHPARDVGTIHRHPPGRSVALKPKLIRVPPDDDDPRRVDEALDWLVEHWVGRVDLPRSVFEIEAERRLRAA